ncbi:MAG: epoxyqueuosine reductase [Candidatus Eisenbacteria sp.]|nr:epoxyqueuosine reductase [Candidatus Eisenbacteria bacterium]
MRELITRTVRSVVGEARTATAYRQALVGFAAAEDPAFEDLKRLIGPEHMLPMDLLPGAASVASFFLPFAAEVVEANRVRKGRVAREWAVAYLETNDLIGTICERVDEELRNEGFASASTPATGNFDRETLTSGWSHKSVAVIAGLGRFGLHHMVITEAGCAGRFGSLVTDAVLEPSHRSLRELCVNKSGGTCKDCVTRCPVGALNGAGDLNRELCWARCEAVARRFSELGLAEVCGKCAVGRCSMGPPSSEE